MMTTPRKLLVPIDFSDCSEAALDYAVALADRLDANVDRELEHRVQYRGS